MKLFQNFLILLGIFILSVPVTYAKEPMKIQKLEDIPLDQAIEAEFPDGSIRTVAGVVQPIPQGISQATGVSLAKQIARVRAQAAIADYINGSEFTQSIGIENYMKSLEENGKVTASVETTLRAAYTAEMRTLALRGIELIDSASDLTAGTVRVIVGFSRDSLESADRNRAMLNQDHSYSSNSKQPGTSPEYQSNTDWRHPMFRQ